MGSKVFGALLVPKTNDFCNAALKPPTKHEQSKTKDLGVSSILLYLFLKLNYKSIGFYK